MYPFIHFFDLEGLKLLKKYMENDSTALPEILQAEATPLQPEDKAWLEYYAEEQRKTPARLEEAARYLTGIISICLTIFIDKKPPNLAWWAIDGLTLASVFWLAAAVMTCIVMFPMRYRYHEASPDSIRGLHEKIVRLKYRLLVAGALLFVAGMFIALYIFLCSYQMAQPPSVK